MRRSEWDIWVLADSAHPLILKSVLEGDVFQMVRADLPDSQPAKRGAPTEARLLEEELVKRCRLELPGVYFAFGTAAIDPISDRALAELAKSLAGHPDWKVTVEGHTDSVGTDAANQTLSERRAEAVRARLAERHGVDTEVVGRGRLRRDQAAGVERDDRRPRAEPPGRAGPRLQLNPVLIGGFRPCGPSSSVPGPSRPSPSSAPATARPAPPPPRRRRARRCPGKPAASAAAAVKTNTRPADACGWLSAAEVEAMVGKLTGAPHRGDQGCVYPLAVDSATARRRAKALELQRSSRSGSASPTCPSSRPTRAG